MEKRSLIRFSRFEQKRSIFIQMLYKTMMLFMNLRYACFVNRFRIFFEEPSLQVFESPSATLQTLKSANFYKLKYSAFWD